MLTVKVAGVWLESLAAHGPVTVEYGRHGSELASWEMSSTFTHPVLRGNALVEIFDGGVCVWCGTLVEPNDDGSFSARGIWRQAEGLYPVDYLGNLTTNIDAALYGSIIQRPELPGWTQPVSINNADWASEPNSDMRLTDLFDKFADENALEWWVTPERAILFGVAPTTPKWVVPHAVAGKGLVPSEDEFFTHLIGRYTDAVGDWKTVTVGSSEAAAIFGRRTKMVELGDLGNTDATRATNVLVGLLLKSGARMGWGEGLELGYGQITTPGGTPAPLNQITSLQMVRLEGVVDSSRPYIFKAYTDIVLESVKYTDGARTISMTPIGYAPRNFEDNLRAAIDAA